MRPILTLSALLLLARSAAAQPPLPPPAPPQQPPPLQQPGAPPPPVRPLEAARYRVRALILDRINRELALDPATAARVAELYDTYAQREVPLRQQLRQDRRRLVAISRGAVAADDATLNRLVDGLLAARARLEAIDQERTLAVRRLLPPAVFARFLLVLPVIRADVRREVMRAARGGLAGGAGAGGADSDDDYE